MVLFGATACGIHFTGFTVTLIIRILQGFGSSASETVVPAVVGDLFFVHERGRWMVCYFSLGLTSLHWADTSSVHSHSTLPYSPAAPWLGASPAVTWHIILAGSASSGSAPACPGSPSWPPSSSCLRPSSIGGNTRCRCSRRSHDPLDITLTSAREPKHRVVQAPSLPQKSA